MSIIHTQKKSWANAHFAPSFKYILWLIENYISEEVEIWINECID